MFIAYEFPPLKRIGAYRPFKFVKFLPQFGIEPTVLTLDQIDYQKVYSDFSLEMNLLDQLPSTVKVVNISSTRIWDPSYSRLRKFFKIYFDVYRGGEAGGWRVNFRKEVEKLINSGDYKAIYVTSPPFSILKLATEISKQYKLPLFIDNRDAWSMWNNIPFGSYFHYLYTLKKEKYFIQSANKVITTSLQIIEDWKKLFPKILPEKYIYIPNGYDTDLKNTNIPPRIVSTTGKKLKIVHVGSFYYNPTVSEEFNKPFYKKRINKWLHYFPRKQDWLYKTPYFLFKMLKKSIELDPSISEKVEVVFAGNKESWFDNMLGQFSLPNVKHIGLISFEESIRLQREADFLFISSPKIIDGKEWAVSGKLCEYLTACKPVFSFVCESAQKDILEQSGLSITMNPDDAEANAVKFIQIINKGVDLVPNKNFIESFDVVKLTEKLAETIKNGIQK